jgi:putative molybdopterin biosynthesis protein
VSEAPTGQGGPRLRLARLAGGLSQQELAAIAGVTRQAVAGLEGGRFEPSLRVALSLAQALGRTVEELFGPEPVPQDVSVTPLVGDLPIGTRVVVAQVGTRLVAVPLTSGDGFLPAGGQLSGPARAIPFGPLPPILVVAGCDPALPLLEGPLRELDPPVGLAWWSCSSDEALGLAANGLVHVAAVHHGRRDGGAPAAPPADEDAGVVVGFAAWREGLIGASTLAEVAAKGMRVVNRPPGAEARRLLDRRLAAEGIEPATLTGYETRASGHLQVASAIASGLAQVGVASEPAAMAYGLRFAPWVSEVCELRIPAPLIDTREVRALLRVLPGPALRRQLGSLPGYDAGPCGEVIWAR